MEDQSFSFSFISIFILHFEKIETYVLRFKLLSNICERGFFAKIASI